MGQSSVEVVPPGSTPKSPQAANLLMYYSLCPGNKHTPSPHRLDIHANRQPRGPRYPHELEKVVRYVGFHEKIGEFLTNRSRQFRSSAWK